MKSFSSATCSGFRAVWDNGKAERMQDSHLENGNENID